MRKTWRPAVLAVLSLVGIVISAYLTARHLGHLADGAPSLCNFNQILNCDAVNTSAWSEVLGIPVSHFGTLFYLGMAALSGFALLRPSLRPRLHGYLLVGASLAVAFSLFLAGVSFRLGAVCIFCVSLYVVNLGLLFVLLPGPGERTALRGLFAGLGKDLGDLARSPWLLFVLLSLVSMGVATYQIRAAVAMARDQAAARSAKSAPAGPDANAAAAAILADASAPALGPPQAPVTIIEISDFECPFCQRAAETLAELRRLYPDKLRILFRNFPLDQACNPLLKRPIHENACAAARAAVCAGEQGRFFDYAELLFTSHGATEPGDLLAHARKLELSEAKFSACLAAPATARRVSQDIELCSRAGVVAVPVFFINGHKLAGAQPLADFQAIIDAELKKHP